MTKLEQLLEDIKTMDCYDLLDLLMDNKSLLQIPPIIAAVSARNDKLKGG